VKNFPDGEVFTGPVETKVDGTVRFTYPSSFAGRRVGGVELEFRGGEVVRAKAEEGGDFLREMLAVDDGARRAGEFSFGLNDAVTEFTGHTLFDEKIGGTVTSRSERRTPSRVGRCSPRSTGTSSAISATAARCTPTTSSSTETAASSTACSESRPDRCGIRPECTVLCEHMFASRSTVLLLALVVLLLLATARPSSGSAGEERYVVLPGDTLWELAAERYGGDPREGVWRIRVRNGLRGSSLQPGAIIYLPAAAGDA
jgi:LysM repeat protein